MKYKNRKTFTQGSLSRKESGQVQGPSDNSGGIWLTGIIGYQGNTFRQVLKVFQESSIKNFLSATKWFHLKYILNRSLSKLWAK